MIRFLQELQSCKALRHGNPLICQAAAPERQTSSSVGLLCYPHLILSLHGQRVHVAWYEKILARPAVQKGLDVPEENSFKNALGDGGQIDEKEVQKKVEDARKFMGSTDKK